MTIDEFMREVPDFNTSMFLSKVNNIFVKLLTSVMLNELNQVDHFISDDVYNYYNDIINRLNSHHQRQMYDELNVKNSNIKSINKVGDKYVVKVLLTARYMDYIFDLNTGSKVSGNDQSRIEVNYELIFVRNINVDEQGIARKCPACGAPIDVNNSGKCEYCGAIYNQEDYDFVLDGIGII